MSEARIKSLRALLPALKVDAVLVTNLINVRYLSGYTGTEGTLLVTKRSAYFYTDSRYTIQAGQQVKGAKVITFTSKIGSVAKTLGRTKVARLGIEGETMTVNARAAYVKALKGIRLVALATQVNELRIRKDKKEVKAIRDVIALSETALSKVRRKLKPGITEKEFASELEIAMIRLGAEGFAFDTIVASGPRGALPHGVASNKKIKKNEMVTIDYGAVYNGYYSDQTVTLTTGKVPAAQKKVYGIVYDAQRAAIDAAKPGMTGAELDAVARKIIEDAGYGKYFGHGLGHGVGMEIHELPRASKLYKKVLNEGEVVTIEPGIYIPGKFGVRLEDMILLTRNGCEVLTTIDKKWRG